MTGNRNIGVMILAAGASKRLGQPKQLVEYNDKTLLQHVIDIAGSIDFTSRVLVLGAKAMEISSMTNTNSFQIVINEDWEEGISGSIKKGLTALLDQKHTPEHTLILLADQPFVTRKDLEALIDLQLKENSDATFSEYAGDVGVPALFSGKVFPQLMKLQGDRGAKKLIGNKDFQFQTLRIPKANFDVDTPKDLELLRKQDRI
ncbi:nucleotidyltransferase family protein [Antarcticibacterium flavum]|uniref:Nucleotidyltransferase family protein n=1 Tax=Antarcticibacterium flavum TaxID=2058175 RepID=A0A5B7X1V2_9FLAO|nr:MULTISPECIES: nucleotidyltransferase family protein [Antarcticibacterium]MCM4161123.1 nucleotidyltransferase family protein [Antarcticibacterium sp. W02-3]QCY69377.1 nucleotidyltransferase family protein [Antarcticibacterium flavum]